MFIFFFFQGLDVLFKQIWSSSSHNPATPRLYVTMESETYVATPEV